MIGDDGRPVANIEAKYRELIDFDSLVGKRAFDGLVMDTDSIEIKAAATAFQADRVHSLFVSESNPLNLLTATQGRLSQVIVCLTTGGTYQFLAGRTIDDEPRALFRLLPADIANLNYHDYLVPPGQGSTAEPIQAVDIFDYRVGELLSKSLRREFLLEHGDKVFGRASDVEQRLIKARAKVNELISEFQKPDLAKAWAIYKELPQSVQDNRPANILGILDCAGVAPEQVTKLVERLPDDDTARAFLFSTQTTNRVSRGCLRIHQEVG